LGVDIVGRTRATIFIFLSSARKWRHGDDSISGLEMVSQQMLGLEAGQDKYIWDLRTQLSTMATWSFQC
jgi:hypothetical protein